MNFLERAKITVDLGVPVIRLHSRMKTPIDTDWPTLATTNLQILEKWDSETPEANCGAVAEARIGGVWFLEIDSPNVAERIFAETGQKLPNTWKIRSSPGRGHVYLFQNAASIKMGNIAQAFVKNGDWSARVDRQFVVSANSIHPRTGDPYEIRSLAPIVEAPQWLIDWCISQKLDKKKLVSADNVDPIPEHFRDDSLTSIGGSLRNKGLNEDEIYTVLTRINIERCQPPIDEPSVRKIAHSVCRYEPPKSHLVLMGGRVVGSSAVSTAQVGAVVYEPEDPVAIEPVPYPVFPHWVMKGTSVYEGLVKPFCDSNTRYPEFMFMPAVTLLLNYVGTKIRVEMKDLIPSIFMVSIGRAGRVIKSSCVKDAIKYFEFMGCTGHGDAKLNNANGRSLVYTAGSPEGFGKELNRLQCHNGVLFYDELKTLSDKAGIDGSDLASKLLSMYESDKVQNVIKNTKDGYALHPGTYCVSLIACTTDKKFNIYWSKLCGADTGLTDRFFFLLQPEKLKDVDPYIYVPTQEGALKTRVLIDKAIERGIYKIVDTSPLKQFLKTNQNNNRAEIRAEKFALYFAIDLGLEEIDEECLERGLALVEYELKVKRFLHVYDAMTKEGSLQMDILHHLRRAGGSMDLRDLYRAVHPERYGTSLWGAVYNGLKAHHWCEERGLGVKGDPKRLVLLRAPEEDE